MPELGTYGSVRGALSNERPYRDKKGLCADVGSDGPGPNCETKPIAAARRSGGCVRSRNFGFPDRPG